MSNLRWAHAALLALALPACASAGTTHTAFARPAGRAAQPGSWQQQATQTRADYVKHAGPRGQADQPYAWVGTQPVYPPDRNRLAQDGPSYLGGRAGQPGSFTPQSSTSWTLARNDGKTQQ